MAVGVVKAINKLKYFIFLSIKKYREKRRAQEKQREFCRDRNVATLN